MKGIVSKKAGDVIEGLKSTFTLLTGTKQLYKLLTPEQKKELRKLQKALYELQNIETSDLENNIAIFWNVEDVKAVRPDLSSKKAREVLNAAKNGHDAEYGVNWDTLKAWADDLYPKRGRT